MGKSETLDGDTLSFFYSYGNEYTLNMINIKDCR